MGWAQEGLDWAWDGHGLGMGVSCLHPRVATACLLHITVAWWAHGVRHGLRMGCAWAVHGHRLPPPTSGYRLLIHMGLGMGCAWMDGHGPGMKSVGRGSSLSSACLSTCMLTRIRSARMARQ